MLRFVIHRKFLNNALFSLQSYNMSMSANVEFAESMLNSEKSDKRTSAEENDENLAKKLKTETEPKVKNRHYAMLLSYLGRDYYGMQRNPSMKTIEEDLISALLKANFITEESFKSIQLTQFQRAARTDKGVSAARQVVSLKLSENVTKDGINAFLPNEIRVFGIKRVTRGFNSKNSCDARTYIYTLPTFAFAPENTIVSQTSEEYVDLVKRAEELTVIDGKPYTEYRLPSDVRARLNKVLSLFEGTHNYHNFTSKVKPLDPRAKRYIMRFSCGEPFIMENMEFVSLEVKGQSFMLHQIRKMVALVIGIIRGIATEDSISEAFKSEKIDVPIAPGLGLILDQVHYDYYDKRYGVDGIHETLDWKECEDDVTAFKRDYIFKHIVDTEIADQSMFNWLVSLVLHTYSTRQHHINS